MTTSAPSDLPQSLISPSAVGNQCCKAQLVTGPSQFVSRYLVAYIATACYMRFDSHYDCCLTEVKALFTKIEFCTCGKQNSLEKSLCDLCSVALFCKISHCQWVMLLFS